MNIMLVSVSERTQEIGLRKAIGAKSNDIRFQFLIEAIVICLFGGLIGTGLAMLVVNGAGWAMTTFVIKDSVWPATVKIEAALAAFSVSMLVGILAGFYPSNKAANLTPVEALRFD
jgi:putative ABC transport system permease protein